MKEPSILSNQFYCRIKSLIFLRSEYLTVRMWGLTLRKKLRFHSTDSDRDLIPYFGNLDARGRSELHQCVVFYRENGIDCVQYG